MPGNASLSISNFPAGVKPALGGSYILIAAWVGMQCLLFWRFGIFTELESVKYITEANNILQNGTVSTPNFWLYSTQIFLIAAAFKLKTGYVSVVIVQLIFNALATTAFFKLCKKLSSTTVAFWLTLVLICAFPYQTYNVYLQTESLFFSFCILFTYYLFSIRQLTWKTVICTFLFLLLLCVTRPSGVLWIPGTILYLFFNFFKRFSVLLKTVALIICSILFLFLLNTAIGSGGELDFMLPFQDERIICGVPTLDHFVNIKMADNPNSIYGLLYYLYYNSEQFFRLAIERSYAFWGLTRSHYSKSHNLYLIVLFFPFIAMMLLSMYSWIKAKSSIALFSICTISITWFSVIMSCDDWHNRFFLTILPYIYILSIPILNYLFKKFSPNVK